MSHADLQSQASRRLPEATSLSVALMDFARTPHHARLLRESLIARGADFILAEPCTSAPADAAWLDADVLLVSARLLDPRIAALVERVSERASPFVIVLSQTGDLTDRIAALEAGADDFLQYDTDAREILARVRALLRRGAQRRDEASPAAGDHWVLDVRGRTLRSPHGSVCELSKGDVRLISGLAEDTQMLTPARAPSEVNSLRVAISRLRRRFRRSSPEELPVRNIWGMGYVFDAPLVCVGMKA